MSEQYDKDQFDAYKTEAGEGMPPVPGTAASPPVQPPPGPQTDPHRATQERFVPVYNFAGDYGVRPPRQRSTRRQNLMGGCLAIGAAVFSFCVVALIVAAILAPSVYRAQRPEIQAIWCSRAERVGMGSIVCDWKPTPPMEVLPGVEGTLPPQDVLDSLLYTATPNTGNAASTETPVSEATEDADPTGGTGGGTEPSPLPPSPSPTSAATEASMLANPSPLPTSAATATMTPRPTLPPPPSSHKLDSTRLNFQWQTWNNCGPATLSTSLSYFGYGNDQQVAANVLKPNREDKNVSPYQMVNYVNQQASSSSNVRALYRIGGTLDMLKRLIANEFPVVIEKGYDVEDLGWMGHYLLLMGYDDAQQSFYAYDSYLGNGQNGSGRPESYEKTLRFWHDFNNLFIVIYPPEREAELMQLLGDHADPTQAIQIALEQAKVNIAANNNDPWAWFNLGDAYTLLGDYEQGAQAFDRAFSLGMPWRTLWYLHTPYLAYYATGRYNDIIARVQTTESSNPYAEEAFFYRAAVYAAQGDMQNALNQVDRALRENSNYQAALRLRDALQNGSFSPQLVPTLVQQS